MKVMLVCTSGGHFATMSGLQKFWSTHERVWVTDYKQDTKSLENNERVYWLPYQGPRKIFPLLRNLLSVFKILRREKPDLIVSTGASIGLNFAWAAKMSRIHFIYIESPSRLFELSMSGKLIYPVCNEFYVQSQRLAEKYTKAVFAGYV